MYLTDNVFNGGILSCCRFIFLLQIGDTIGIMMVRKHGMRRADVSSFCPAMRN